MPNKEKSLKFEITIKRDNEGILEVIMTAEVTKGDGSPENMGTDIFLLSENLDYSQRTLKGRVGQNVCEMFLNVMT